MSPSQEDYLKTILIIQKQLGYVRSVDIAEKLSVTKPSVSRTVHLLESQGLIVLDSHRHIKLTPAGQTQAAKLYDRQRLLKTLLISLGVSAQTARCRCLPPGARAQRRKLRQAQNALLPLPCCPI